MMPKFRVFDKKYKKIMKVNEINFEKLPVRHQANIVALNGTIESFVDKLKSEINEIAKEYGNSYLDEDGNTVWVKSEVKGE